MKERNNCLETTPSFGYPVANPNLLPRDVLKQLAESGYEEFDSDQNLLNTTAQDSVVACVSHRLCYLHLFPQGLYVPYPPTFHR